MMQKPKAFYRKRLSETGEKVRNVIVIIWIEELDNYGWTYYDLLSYLDGLHMPACVSPIHDRDTWDGQSVLDWCTMHINPETGDLDEKYIDKAPYVGMVKKPHIHLMFKGPNQQDAFWWTELMSGLLPDMKPTRWDKCFSVNGSMRYWAHMDSTHKARYSEYDIVGIGGIDLSPLSKKDEQTCIEYSNDVYDMITFYKIRYFHQLIDTAKSLGEQDLVSYIQGTHTLWRNYLLSRMQECKDDAYLKKIAAERAVIASGYRTVKPKSK